MLAHLPRRREVDHIGVGTDETPAVPWYCEPRQWKVQRLSKPARFPFTRETPGLSRVGMAAVRRLGRSALMEAKRTWFENDPMSANDPSRT
jgi:hypothetical protein